MKSKGKSLGVLIRHLIGAGNQSWMELIPLISIAPYPFSASFFFFFWHGPFFSANFVENMSKWEERAITWHKSLALFAAASLLHSTRSFSGLVWAALGSIRRWRWPQLSQEYHRHQRQPKRLTQRKIKAESPKRWLIRVTEVLERHLWLFPMVCLWGKKQLEVAGAKWYMKWEEVGREEEKKELGLHQVERMSACFREELS